MCLSVRASNAVPTVVAVSAASVRRDLVAPWMVNVNRVQPLVACESVAMMVVAVAAESAKKDSSARLGWVNVSGTRAVRRRKPRKIRTSVERRGALISRVASNVPA